MAAATSVALAVALALAVAVPRVLDRGDVVGPPKGQVLERPAFGYDLVVPPGWRVAGEGYRGLELHPVTPATSSPAAPTTATTSTLPPTTTPRVPGATPQRPAGTAAAPQPSSTIAVASVILDPGDYPGLQPGEAAVRLPEGPQGNGGPGRSDWKARGSRDGGPTAGPSSAPRAAPSSAGERPTTSPGRTTAPPASAARHRCATASRQRLYRLRPVAASPSVGVSSMTEGGLRGTSDFFMNFSSDLAMCHLEKRFTVEFWKSGRRVPVQGDETVVTLAGDFPEGDGEFPSLSKAWLWRNWCGHPNSSVTIRFRGLDGLALDAASAMRPPCVDRAKPSTLEETILPIKVP